MATPYIGEIRIVSFGYAPSGWALCNGQTMSIAQNQALFSILGTTYGGNGTNTFMLPNLQGNVPYHAGSGYVQGQAGGSAAIVLNAQQIPLHTHTMVGSSASPNKGQLANNLWPTQAAASYDPAPTAIMNQSVIGTIGGQPHNNMSPFLVLNFVIALRGIYPSRN